MFIIIATKVAEEFDRKTIRELYENKDEIYKRIPFYLYNSLIVDINRFHGNEDFLIVDCIGSSFIVRADRFVSTKLYNYDEALRWHGPGVLN